MFNVEHPVRGVLGTVLRRLCTGHSELRLLAAASGSALPPVDIDHPVRGMLRTVLRRFCTGLSKRWPGAAAFGSAPFAADVYHPVRGVLCTVLHRFVPATPNFGCLPQPSVLHLLLQTFTIPSGACCAQYSTVLYRPLRTSAACRSLRFCTSSC